MFCERTKVRGEHEERILNKIAGMLGSSSTRTRKIRPFSIMCVLILANLTHFAQARQQESILRLDATLDGIISPDAKAEKLADSPPTDRIPDTREGPVWVRKGGYLLYSVLGT